MGWLAGWLAGGFCGRSIPEFGGGPERELSTAARSNGGEMWWFEVASSNCTQEEVLAFQVFKQKTSSLFKKLLKISTIIQPDCSI